MAMSAEEFVAHEARLLDERQFEAWLELFADDGRYWVPLAGAAQADASSHNSIALEDRLLLSLRVKRLRNPRAHSQRPGSHCQHVLQAPRLLPQAVGDAQETVLQTAFVYTEVQGERQVQLTGTCLHRLIPDQGTDSGWRLREKRVNLLQCGQALPAIQLFI